MGGGLNGSTQHPREIALPRLLAAESCRADWKAGATMVSGDLAHTSICKPAPEDTVLTGDRDCHWNQAAGGSGKWPGGAFESLAIPLIQIHFTEQCCSDKVLHRPVESAVGSRHSPSRLRFQRLNDGNRPQSDMPILDTFAAPRSVYSPLKRNKETRSYHSKG
jgi:hypothetical protein